MKIKKFNESLNINKEYIEDLFLTIEDLSQVVDITVYPFFYNGDLIAYNKDDFKNSKFNISDFKNGWRIDITISNVENDEFAFDLDCFITIFNEIDSIRKKIGKNSLEMSSVLKKTLNKIIVTIISK